MEEKKNFFEKLKQGLTKTRDAFSRQTDNIFKAFVKVDEELFNELEEALIMADIGAQASMEIVDRLRGKVKTERITDGDGVREALKQIISEMLTSEDSTLCLDTKPSVIMVVGVNGVGKTTAIGKLAAKLTREGKKVLLAAADTFRAAASEQLQVWADRCGVDMIKHTEGSDPAAVVFDAISAAKSRGVDVLICDTAGRLHNKKNLMLELGKIYRVIERELGDCSKEVLLVLDATTGQNGVNQAQVFGEAVPLTGIVLTKLDGTAKGGIVISIKSKLGIPIKLTGVGEGIDDLQEFDAQSFARALFED